MSLERQAAEVHITLRDPSTAYAIFNDEALPNWHPVSQPGECKVGEETLQSHYFKPLSLLFSSPPHPTLPVPLNVSFNRHC